MSLYTAVAILLSQATAPSPAATAPAVEAALAPVVTTEVPKAVVTPEPPKPAPAKNDAGPSRLAGGTSAFFQPGILMQGWLVGDHWRNPASTKNPNTSTFRLRRAEIHVKGDLLPKVLSYRIMIDPARVLDPKDTKITVSNQNPAPTSGTGESVTVKTATSTAVLQDFFITLSSTWVDVSLGQFKVPVSWEAYNPSSQLLLPERAYAVTTFGDKRDVGLRFAKTFQYLGYSLGVFNGNGQGQLDNDNGKDVALRLEAYPIKGAMVGGVVYRTVSTTRSVNTTDRWEIDARYQAFGAIVQAEWINGHTVRSKVKTDGHGGYLSLAYLVTPMIQPVFRMGFVDPNTDDKRSNRLWSYEAGVDVFVQGNEVKLQAAVGYLNYRRNPAADTKAPDSDQITGTLAVQLWY